MLIDFPLTKNIYVLNIYCNTKFMTGKMGVRDQWIALSGTTGN